MVELLLTFVFISKQTSHPNINYLPQPTSCDLSSLLCAKGCFILPVTQQWVFCFVFISTDKWASGISTFLVEARQSVSFASEWGQ